MSDSSRNHSDTNPAVGGRPASVRLPMASPVPLHGRRRTVPRRSSRLSRPSAAWICALAVNSSDLAIVCATICSVAASSPTASSPRLCRAAPTRATPNPARISPEFSTLE